MTEPNNAWVGDFHKALEQRKEPRAEAATVTERPTLPEGMSYFDRVIAPQTKEQWHRITAEVYNRAFESSHAVRTVTPPTGAKLLEVTFVGGGPGGGDRFGPAGYALVETDAGLCWLPVGSFWIS